MTVARNLSLLSPNVSTSGTVNNAGLTNSSITINGTVVALGGTVTTSAGTVTSVGGTGTVSGLSLTGTVTSSGNLTLGGALDLSSPPAIGNTTPSTAKFTTITIPSILGNAVISANSSITSWLYSNKSFSIVGQESAPTGLFFSPNGTKMYVNGTTGDDVNEYTLSTAWDVTTATFVTVFSTATQDTAPTDLFFKPDGLTMYVLGDTNNIVFQYTLGTAWSVATASYASKSFSVATQDATPSGIWFKPDGTIMYVVGSLTDAVYQYTLSTAWDVSTATYANKSYSVVAQETVPQQVNLSADGTKMWVLGQTGDDVWEYSLGTAWDISTAAPVNNFYTGFQAATPTGMFIDSSVAKCVFILDSTSDAVYQYNTATNSTEFNTDKLYIPGTLSVNNNLVAGQNAYIDGTLVVQGASTLGTTTLGSITITGSINANTNTNNFLLGTVQTTGTWTAGGITQTGAITLGQSTVSQTTSIQAGATVSGSTKTIAIGTGGLAGSTTAITIGSTTGTNTITANGNWTFPNTITGSITGTAANVTNTVAIANGGTGATSAAAALTNLGAYAATNPNGYTTNTGTVTSVSGTAPIVSSGGTAPAISISAATTSAAGSMSAADKTKLDGIAAGATANTGTVTGVTGTAPVVSSGGTAPAISMAAATSTVNGYMTSTYAAKLDGIAAGATANTGTVTGVTGTAPVVSSGGTAPAISMAAATSTVNGYMTSTYAAKLDGIAAGATANTGTVTSVSTGTGLSGGTITSTGTISLANTTVTAGSYTLASITVDAQGRITAASSGSAGGVTSFSAGTTGLTPNTATTGAVTLAGTLAIANGGTGATTAAAARTALGLTGVATTALSSSGSAGISTINSDGTHEVSRYIDFHAAGGDAVDYTVRLDGGAAGSTTLSLVGSFSASGNVTAYSDERLKTNWNMLPVNFIERLANVKSGTYTRTDTGERQAGNSAQNWQTLLPEVVVENETGTLSLAYGNAALVSVVELAKRVVDQEARIAKLEFIINSLKK